MNGYVPRWRPPFSSLQSRSLGTTFTHRCRSSDFIACYPLPRYWFLSVLGNPPMYRSLALTHGRSRLRSLCERAVAVTLAGPNIDSTSRHHPEPAPPTAVHVGGRGLVYVREAGHNMRTCVSYFVHPKFSSLDPLFSFNWSVP